MGELHIERNGGRRVGQIFRKVPPGRRLENDEPADDKRGIRRHTERRPRGGRGLPKAAEATGHRAARAERTAERHAGLLERQPELADHAPDRGGDEEHLRRDPLPVGLQAGFDRTAVARGHFGQDTAGEGVGCRGDVVQACP